MSERFWAKVNKETESGCWEWTGALALGYGAYQITRKKQVGAHRHAWQLINGEIPEGLICCHKCDNKRCVNPDHIFLGSRSDNIKDFFFKGYTNRKRNRIEGPPNFRCRVSDILKERGKDERWLAVEYGVDEFVAKSWMRDEASLNVVVLFRLARILECKVDELYKYSKEE